MNMLANTNEAATQLENVLINGDLSKLASTDRVMYYKSVCESVGLNPLTKPFDYLVLNGKTVLYAKRDATDQLRKIHGVSIKISARDQVGDVYIVTAQATDKTGRTDEATGAIVTAGLKSADLANAYMKAETKAKRRVTLSICGLGLFDESELDSIQSHDSDFAVDAPKIGSAEKIKLAALIAETGADEAKFCAHFKIDCVDSMPLSMFAKAEGLLLAKLKQKGAQQ